jgi:hypothetical protein
MLWAPRRSWQKTEKEVSFSIKKRTKKNGGSVNIVAVK